MGTAAMTDRRRTPRVGAIYGTAAALFVAAAAGLGWQMADGRDPALGAARASFAAAAPRRVLIRRIERTIVVTRLLPPKPVTPAPGASSAPAIATANAPSSAAGGAPAAAPPPVVAAPAPAPPPPPPAPVTKTS